MLSPSGVCAGLADGKNSSKFQLQYSRIASYDAYVMSILSKFAESCNNLLSYSTADSFFPLVGRSSKTLASRYFFSTR